MFFVKPPLQLGQSRGGLVYQIALLAAGKIIS
jgi:hypothetical protein